MKIQKMKNTVLSCLVLLFALHGVGFARNEGTSKVISELWAAHQGAASDHADAAAAERLERATQAVRDWKEKQGPDFDVGLTQQEVEALWLLDFPIAEAWARAGDYHKALVYFKKEAAPYFDSEGDDRGPTKGRFLDGTRNPSSFSDRIFALHSEIMAHTGSGNRVPGAGYKVLDVSPEGGAPAYVFVYEPVEEGENQMELKGLDEDEQRQMIDLSVRNEKGRFGIAGRAEVVGKRDGVSVTVQSSQGRKELNLKGVTKFIEYKGEGRIPFVRESPISSFALTIKGGKIEQPIDALKEAQDRDRSRSAAQPPKETPSSKTSIDGLTSSTWRTVVPVVSVAAVGLLWLLLKRRK